MLALAMPHPPPTFDEAKYLAIGVNALEGHGPRTAFGDLFLPHSPMWPMLFAWPAAAFGVSPWMWGYLLNGAAATGLLLLAAWLARPFGPRTMLLAVATLIGWLSLFALARTARLDVPEAALTLAYLAVAASAVETGLLRRGVLAGVVFAWAFLVKEASLVLLAAPFLIALAQGRPLERIARAAGLVLLVTVPLVAWWFGWYAATTGKIYAFGLGSAWLVPLAIGTLAAGVGLLLLGSGHALARRVASRLRDLMPGRRQALGVAAALLLAWVLAFLVAFSRSEVQAGRPLLDLPNIARWIRAWATDVAPIALAGLGLVGAVRMAARGDDRPLAPLVVLGAGLPWLLLVAVQGEPPRNDIALFAVLAGAGAAGWLQLPGALAGHDRAMTAAGAAVGADFVVVADLQLVRHGVMPGTLRGLKGIAGSAVVGAVAGGLGASQAAQRWLLERLPSTGRVAGRTVQLRGVAVAVVTILAVGTLGVAAPRMARASVTSSAALADEVAAWIEANLPAGSTVMFGSVLANETALRLPGTYELRSLQARLGVTDATAPLGIRVGGVAAADIVALDRHPRQTGYLAFTASQVDHILRTDQPAVWVYVTGLDTATPSLVPWLATVPGISPTATIDSPAGLSAPLVAHIYRIDLAALAVPSDETFASPEAVSALLDALGSVPQAPAIATALLPRLVLTATGPAADAVMARLRSVAGG